MRITRVNLFPKRWSERNLQKRRKCDRMGGDWSAELPLNYTDRKLEDSSKKVINSWSSSIAFDSQLVQLFTYIYILTLKKFCQVTPSHSLSILWHDVNTFKSSSFIQASHLFWSSSILLISRLVDSLFYNSHCSQTQLVSQTAWKNS